MSEFGAELEQLKELEKLGAVTPTSLRLPQDTTYERVEALFRYFGRVHGAVRFYIGDLLAWSEERFGEGKMYQAAEATGLTEKTLLRYLLVSGRVAPARRRENLSFSIHAEVASLNPALQDKWLKQAEENNWSVRQIRHLLRDEGVIETREQPQWTPPAVLDGEVGNGAQGDPATGESLPSETAPASPSSPVPVLDAPRIGIPFQLVTLVRMRDEFEQMLDVLNPSIGETSFEERRDALNWALERLSPEFA